MATKKTNTGKKTVAKKTSSGKSELVAGFLEDAKTTPIKEVDENAVTPKKKKSTDIFPVPSEMVSVQEGGLPQSKETEPMFLEFDIKNEEVVEETVVESTDVVEEKTEVKVEEAKNDTPVIKEEKKPFRNYVNVHMGIRYDD